MKKKISVLVNNRTNNGDYIKFLSERFDVTVIGADKYAGEEHVDFVLFTGGEDVYPGYYNQTAGSKTNYNTDRDKYEKIYMFDRFREIPKLGICRGAQYLTVLSGGSLIQDVNGHATGQLHYIEMSAPLTGNIYKITSTHHQMMYPFNMKKNDYQIVAFSKYFMSTKYLNGQDVNIELPKNFVEPEIVFYPNTNSLCIQGHPEMNTCPNETKDVVFRLINYFLKI